jgi:acyl dehydratase
MPNPDLVGRTYPAVRYHVTRAAIDAYVAAVAEDAEAYGEIAPPMFAVLYAGAALPAALSDPELAIDFSHLVHGAQTFHWPGPVVRAGDVIDTVLTVAEIRETAGLTFYGFSTVSENARGQLVASGVWTNIVREAR